MIYLVSACLLGENCKYNGGNNRNQAVLDFCALAREKGNEIIPVCPERMGGLSSPRPPCEIRGGSGEEVLAGRARVVNDREEDLTEAFLLGAEKTLATALEETERYYLSSIQAGAQSVGPMPVQAVLKARSPSCGKAAVYDGTFSGTIKEGNGVAAALLLKNGIPVITEEEI